MNLSDISKKIPVLQKGANWKYCLVFWIPLLLLASPLFYLVYSPKWIVYWFTDFNWVFPYGGGFGSTRDVIVSNIIRATIMFVPAYFCLIIMIISIIIIWLYAPVENVNKKINEKSKKKFKRLSIIEIVLSSFVAILILCMFHFYQALVIFPTFFVIDISVLVEVILSKRRNKK